MRFHSTDRELRESEGTYISLANQQRRVASGSVDFGACQLQILSKIWFSFTTNSQLIRKSVLFDKSVKSVVFKREYQSEIKMQLLHGECFIYQRVAARIMCYKRRWIILFGRLTNWLSEVKNCFSVVSHHFKNST